MKTVHKSVLIWFSAAEMFALVADVPRYPEFLPWCDKARILTQEKEGVTAEIGMSLAGFRQSFVTQNNHVHLDNQGHSLALKLIKGPFSRLEGDWQFIPVGDETARACRVDLRLSYGFESATLAGLVGPVFDKIASSLVDAFVKRANQIYV
ncbi:MAG: type II toxin-antitoxin system RatA family toxin [Burkholderiaceae bacterium]